MQGGDKEKAAEENQVFNASSKNQPRHILPARPGRDPQPLTTEGETHGNSCPTLIYGEPLSLNLFA